MGKRNRKQVQDGRQVNRLLHKETRKQNSRGKDVFIYKFHRYATM